MAKLSLSTTGELNIDGEFLTDPDIIFSLSEFGDLITKSFTVIDEPNIENPNLLMSIGVDGVTLYGIAEKATPPEPKPNLIDIAGGYLVNEYAEILEETEEYYIVECQFIGAGLTFPILLEGNKRYRYVINIEIIESSEGASVGFGVFNISIGDYVKEIIISESNIGVIQNLVGSFETGSDISEGDILEIDALGRGAGTIVYKLYKEAFSVTEA